MAGQEGLKDFLHQGQVKVEPNIVVEIPDNADWIARTLAILGTIVALASLGWQVIQWRLSGARIKVEDAHFGFAGTEPEPTEVIGFRARNVGRTVATVDAWGFETPDRQAIVFPRQPPQWSNPTLPHKIEPGHSATWTIPLAWIRELMQKEQLNETPLRPQIRLGTGEDVTSKNTFVPPN
ncbi:MAG: hypothetical protein ACRDLB_07025 [Actinomycetota bacterium]